MLLKCTFYFTYGCWSVFFPRVQIVKKKHLVQYISCKAIMVKDLHLYECRLFTNTIPSVERWGETLHPRGGVSHCKYGDFKHKHFFCNMLKIKTKQEQQSKTILKVTNLNNQSTIYYGTRKWTKNIFNSDYKATNFSSGIL